MVADQPSLAMAGESGRTPVPAAGQGVCLLALATSGEWCSVARYRHGGVIGESECRSELLGAAQSERILALVREVTGGDLQAIDAIAFDAGPGSFTGLRIGCAVAQGLGLALGRPLIAVDTPASLAWQRVRAGTVPGAWVLVASDARIGQLYVALYRVEAAESAEAGRSACGSALPRAEPVLAARLISRQGFGEVLQALWPTGRVPIGEVLLAGNAWTRFGLLEEWAARHGPAAAMAPGENESYVRADALAELAHRGWCDGLVVHAGEASPLYVRDKIALDRDEQRALRERRRADDAGASRP